MIKDKFEAEEKARQLWGQNAFAFIDTNSYFVVGEINGPFRQMYGYGKSWDAAFNAAKLHLN